MQSKTLYVLLLALVMIYLSNADASHKLLKKKIIRKIVKGALVASAFKPKIIPLPLPLPLPLPIPIPLKLKHHHGWDTPIPVPLHEPLPVPVDVPLPVNIHHQSHHILEGDVGVLNNVGAVPIGGDLGGWW